VCSVRSGSRERPPRRSPPAGSSAPQVQGPQKPFARRRRRVPSANMPGGWSSVAMGRIRAIHVAPRRRAAGFSSINRTRRLRPWAARSPSGRARPPRPQDPLVREIAGRAGLIPQTKMGIGARGRSRLNARPPPGVPHSAFRDNGVLQIQDQCVGAGRPAPFPSGPGRSPGTKQQRAAVSCGAFS